MKIDIEYSEVALMKSKIVNNEKLIKQLQDKLSKLNEVGIKYQVRELAYEMYGSVMKAVLKKLGFTYNGVKISFRELENELGEEWWLSPKFEVEFGATLTDKVRRAFVNMGLKFHN